MEGRKAIIAPEIPMKDDFRAFREEEKIMNKEGGPMRPEETRVEKQALQDPSS